MLTPQQLTEIIDTMYPLLDGLNSWITTDLISRFMARMGRGEDLLLTGTDEWQLQVYKEAGGHLEDLQAQLQKFTNQTNAEIQAIFEDAGIKAWEADSALYTRYGLTDTTTALSENMIKILTDSYTRTCGTVRNFTRTTATASQQRLYDVLDNAHFKVVTGAQSYTAAVQEAVKDLSTIQTKVQYPTGHKDTIETAVLRAVRTGVAQASGNMAIQGMEERDWDLIRVSAHLGARYGDGGENPGNHFWWQGKLYSRTGRSAKYPPFEETTGYGTGEGLCGWNCRHSFGPGDPDHNPYADYDKDENKKVYDTSQKQRQMEATIRRNRVKALGYQTAMDAATDDVVKAALENDYQKALQTLQKSNKVYQDFCRDHDLKVLSDRINVAKWNRQAAAAARKAALNKE